MWRGMKFKLPFCLYIANLTRFHRNIMEDLAISLHTGHSGTYSVPSLEMGLLLTIPPFPEDPECSFNSWLSSPPCVTFYIDSLCQWSSHFRTCLNPPPLLLGASFTWVTHCGWRWPWMEDGFPVDGTVQTPKRWRLDFLPFCSPNVSSSVPLNIFPCHLTFLLMMDINLSFKSGL